MKINLTQKTIASLADHQGSWPEIARQCQVSYSWVCKFANGKIPDPSALRVERVAIYLKKHGRKPTAGF